MVIFEEVGEQQASSDLFSEFWGEFGEDCLDVLVKGCPETEQFIYLLYFF